MSETDVNMDVTIKRRLPVWMCKRSALDELREPGNDECQVSLQGQAQTQAPLPNVKNTNIDGGEELARQETNNLGETPGLFFQGETRKRSRRSKRLNVNPRISRCNEADLERKKASAVDSQSILWESSGYEKPKQIIHESGPENDVDLEALLPPESEDEVELTVEDLLSIAEEYVNVDKEKRQLLTASEESKSEAQSSSLSVFTGNNFGLSCGDTPSSPPISKCKTAHSFGLTATGTLERAPHKISRTGDAAQDMLNLFLGPLLRNPTERELERTQQEATAACEFSVPGRDNLPSEGLPVTKKKSSLKDKVAIFLTDSARTNAA